MKVFWAFVIGLLLGCWLGFKAGWIQALVNS